MMLLEITIGTTFVTSSFPRYVGGKSDNQESYGHQYGHRYVIVAQRSRVVRNVVVAH